MRNIQIGDIARLISLRRVTLAWYRHFKLLYSLLFILVLGFGGYLWYFNLYDYSWDETQKKTYAEKVFKETSFKKDGFHELLEKLKVRSAEQGNPLQVSRNLFTGEPVIKQ